MKFIRVITALLVMALVAPASAKYLTTKHVFTDAPGQAADTLIMLVPEGQQPVLEGWADNSKAQLKAAAATAEFTGKAKHVVEVLAPINLSASRVWLVGVGEDGAMTRAEAELLGASLAAKISTSKGIEQLQVASQLVADADTNTALVAALAHGIDLRNYRFDRYKSKPEPRPSQSFSWQVVDSAAATAAYQQTTAIAEGVFVARDITNLPGGDGYPKAIAELAKAAVKGSGVKVTILNPAQVKAAGMGSLYGVSQGSQHKAHLLVLHYKGSDDQPIALVGKGNTFDTGGYNLKTTGSSILRMQTDKAGGAAVIGSLLALARQQAKVNVVGVVPLSHNLISGEAILPGDVLKAGDGTTIEVTSTDAEGRLILADGIWYARDKFKPRAIADIATLTGSKVGALGSEYSAIFSAHSDLIDTMTAAGKTTGEIVWQLPLGPYNNPIRSHLADIKNTGSPGAQAGALFLQHFAKDTPWIHIDMAGSAFSESASGLAPAGGNGYGVRLLTEWVQLYSATAEK